jgi:hypothetical protein
MKNSPRLKEAMEELRTSKPSSEYDDDNNELEPVKGLWVTKECEYLGKGTGEDMLILVLVIGYFCMAAKIHKREQDWPIARVPET